MSEKQLDAIRKCAREDLILVAKYGHHDQFLWEHAHHIAQSAQYISELKLVREYVPDDVAVLAASLYLEAGWVARHQQGQIEISDIRIGQLNEAGREMGIVLMEKSLLKYMDSESLRKARLVIQTISRKPPETIEGQIISDAINLNDFGYIPLWHSIRRGIYEGKGIQAVIDTWKRKKEYHFWNARLRDAFIFQPVQKVAEDRFKKFERFMDELETQHTSADLADRMVQHKADRSHQLTIK